MKHPLTSSAFCLIALSLAITVNAKTLVDCNKGASLARALEEAKPGETVLFTGNCNGSITILQNGLTLQGQGVAVVDGQRQTAITIRGVQNVNLSNFEVRNGVHGILLDTQAQANLSNVAAYNNNVFGIALQNHSNAMLKDVKTYQNRMGLDVESTSAVSVAGKFVTEQNQVFGVNINAGSSLTLNNAQITAQNNLLGIQVGTGANVFLADPNCEINVLNNQTTGLTIVSGSHLVSFGGKINAKNNGRNGVSVNSKAGLDLDAASVLESAGNGGNGLQLAESAVMTLFNTTAFSGQPGSTTLNVHNNTGNGIAVLLGSNLTSVNQVILSSQNNGGIGVLADNGSAITLLNATVNGNAKDVSLSFGARSDIRSNSTIGSITCDTSVLSRGDVVCPAMP